MPVTRPNSALGNLEDVRSAIRSGQGHPLYSAMLLGLRSSANRELILEVKRGFRYAAFVRFQRNTSMSLETLAQWTGIRPRTLARRKKEGKLRPDESDRLLRASRVFARALELFEADDSAALSWLRSPQRALGGAAPLELAETEIGASEVESLIGRLEHGIPS